MGDLLGPGAITVPPGDVEALAGALGALTRDPERRRAMGQEGRRRVAGLSWDRTAVEVSALVASLVTPAWRPPSRRRRWP
jgi:glycosyltransferase involved in cell wall biosynthesis